MKTKITLELNTDLLRKIRAIAAEDGKSVSTLLASKLEKIGRARQGYERARKRALARLREGFDLNWAPASSRSKLHER
jgi:hypothetical protein